MSFFTRRRSQQSMKKLYNWFYAHYGIIEKSLTSTMEEVTQSVIRILPDVSKKSALEYACGSGLLSLQLARYFKTVEARDQSSGMLERARKRAETAHLTVHFNEGNILEIKENNNSYDWAFVSFALHLFAPEHEKDIVQKLLAVSRIGVIIIDHGKQWSPLSAFVEWLEGSYYDVFIKIDFSAFAKEIGASRFEEKTIKTSSVMIFYK
jgi:ubiquinone/menaquinone biosynthesis C-methylase UbiE